MHPEQYRLPFNHTLNGLPCSAAATAITSMRYNSYEQANSIKKCLLPISRQHSGTADIPKLVVTLYTEV